MRIERTLITPAFDPVGLAAAAPEPEPDRESDPASEQNPFQEVVPESCPEALSFPLHESQPSRERVPEQGRYPAHKSAHEHADEHAWAWWGPAGDVPPGQIAGVVLVHLSGEEGQRPPGLGQAVARRGSARSGGVGVGKHTGDEVRSRSFISGVPAGGR